MKARLFDHPEQLPEKLLANCRTMPLPDTLLMCRPDFFKVLDVKNPHMEGNIGKVDIAEAQRQWDAVKDAFLKAGCKIELIDPLPDCEDMVFCANQTFPGFDGTGQKLCLLSKMKHASRQREVAGFEAWFKKYGFSTATLPQAIKNFEGSGDAIWHPGRALVWGGCGFRTEPDAYKHLSELFEVPVIRLPLQSDRFYHLDTCFAAIDERTVLIHPGSLSPEGVAMIRSVFENVIECNDREAREGMACNAAAVGGKSVLIQKGNPKTVAALKKFGYAVFEVETSEFLKSGGSVFCMKMYLF